MFSKKKKTQLDIMTTEKLVFSDSNSVRKRLIFGECFTLISRAKYALVNYKLFKKQPSILVAIPVRDREEAERIINFVD